MHSRPLSLQAILARRNDPGYAPARSAQDYLMKTYGITHFEPETYLPTVRERPNDPDNRAYCDELRKMMRFAARECLGWNIFQVIVYVADGDISSGQNLHERRRGDIQTGGFGSSWSALFLF
jgi:hypothetical protein